MTTKIDFDFLSADLSAVESLISELTESDFVTRWSLESRRDQIRTALASAKVSERVLASASLFFSGKPVIGSRGIESTFSAEAIASFQDIVAKVSATRRAKPLKTKGIVPEKNKSLLHITRVVHGSFGFQLEEVDDGSTQPMFDSTLKQSVDQTAKLLASFDERDDEVFGKAVEDVNTRVLDTVCDFFEMMQKNQATFRLVSGSIDKKYDETALSIAVQRAKITTIEEDEMTLIGTLNGVLPEIRTFEFAPDSSSTIHGKIDRTISDEAVSKINNNWANKESEIVVHRRRFMRQGDTYHTAYFLLEIRNRSRKSKITTPASAIPAI